MNQETLDRLQKEEDEIIFANAEQRSNLLGKVNMLIRELETLYEQIRKSPTDSEVRQAKFEAKRKNCWDKYPNVSDQVDYALCGSTWAARNLPYDPFFPRMVEEAIAEFGEELELEIEKSWIRDEAGEIQGTASMTKMHIAYLDWLENYQHEQ